VKAALARARALHGGVIGGEGKSPAVGDRAVGGEDPTLPPMPAVKPGDARGGMGRAVTEPPPVDDGEKSATAAGDDDKTIEQRARSPKEPKELDGVATEDTGPLPRVAGDKD
jgi:hypothetical protein